MSAAGPETGVSVTSSAPYTRRDRIRAINWSALIGWGYFAATYLISTGNIGGLPFFALWGLPIVFAITWLIAGPILWWLIRGPISWFAAACWGAAISGLMALLGLGWSRFQGWQASHNPNFHYTIGGGDFVQDVDGVFTPYGWWVAVQGSLQFVLLGIAVALIVRAIIGAGEKTAAE